MKKIILLVKSIPKDARWITVNGGEGKGQAVLIQPQPDGSSKVIGGAGGSLNHLRLRSVKSVSTYRKEAAKKQEAKRASKREQVKAEKADGSHASKQEARKDIRTKRTAAERQVIESVAKKVGWSQDELAYPEEDYAHLSEGAQDKLRNRHHKALLSKAKEVIKQSRERLVSDAQARADAGIGELPLFSDSPEALSVADLDPDPSSKAKLGFSSNYKGRAEDQGLSQDALKKEAQNIKLAGMTDEQRAAAFARGDSPDLIKKELEGIKEPGAPNANASLVSAQEALELLKEGKRLAAIEKMAREANADVDAGPAEPKAFVIDSVDSDDLDAKVKADIENDLRTVQTVSFLSEVHKIAGDNPNETLGGHVGVGAYNSINALALSVGGSALVDRSVVDVLGIAGASQVLAARIKADLSPEEAAHVAGGIEDWHKTHYMKTSTEAIKQARELTEAAKAIELSDDAVNGADLELAQEMNARRRAATSDAQRILGQSLGEMEANAALVMAMKQGSANHIEVSLGKVGIEQAIQQVRAIGLVPGDYSLNKVGSDTFLRVSKSGIDRLASPIDREELNQVRRNLEIIQGDQDEDDWLPLGVADRPDLAMSVEAGVAERFAQDFNPTDNLEESLQDYIGARAADGDPPADILADIQSAGFFHKAGDTEAYRAALDAVAPLKGEDGKMQRIESLTDKFEEYADAYVEKLGGERTTLSRQKFEVSQRSVDALHRALTETPEGVAAHKQIGELGHKDQASLRSFFGANIAKDSPEAGQLKADLAVLEKQEPEKESIDMFGDTAVNPEWQEWRSKRDGLTAEVNASTLTWSKYVDAMGGNAKAYESVQDLIKSKLAKSFVDAYNKLNPESPLKIGKQVVRNNLDHLDAVDPEARAARMEKQRALIDGMRERVDGRYASGSVSDKIAAQKEAQAAYEQSQMGFFSSEDLFADNSNMVEAPLGSDERYTLGHAAERQIAGMMGVVGQNFKPGQPTKLWKISMSGKYVAQQRAIKLLAENKRVVLAAGAGSGKTNMYLGGHAHLAGLGKVKRSLMLVPSIVQGQFNGEALRLLEAGKFKTHIQPGASQAERIAAYKDPDTNIAVMTHQSFRDDMIHLGAQQAGIDSETMTSSLQGMTSAERKDWINGVMDAEGIKFDASFIDEAHDTLNRAGKENSTLANVTEALGHSTPYHVTGSGDPVKNDSSEIHSMLQKMDPVRYANRDDFMRRYGADTIASKNALRRELARYVFPTSITPDIDRERKIENIDLSAGQNEALASLDANLAAVRTARRSGKVDIEAIKAISPNSFDGVPESEHNELASRLQKSIGMLRNAAYNNVINNHKDNAKVDRAVQMVLERGDKQGVVFARNRASIELYKNALEKAGKRVVTITGSDSAKEKDAKRRMFNPEKGEAQADILIASDAGAVGMNLQSGAYLIQHDISMTAKTHSQRNARIDRIGQKNNIELIDLVGNHSKEKRDRERLMKKYELKDMLADPLDGLDDTGVAGAIKARRMSAEGRV